MKNELISISLAWDKEKIWVSDRIRTYDLPNTGRTLYPLELRRTYGQRGHIVTRFIFDKRHAYKDQQSAKFTIFHSFIIFYFRKLVNMIPWSYSLLASSPFKASEASQPPHVLASSSLQCRRFVFARESATSRSEEEMGRVKRSGKGAGREKRKYFFSPPPPPFPSFALAHTVRVTISTLPNLPLS